jgi:hypothetical protein
MIIFLSYASEHRAEAGKIAQTLRGRGHLVFFDKDDLPAATSYDAQIEQAIKRSDLMIFLVSPESIAAGRFTLTELYFARKKWPSARGRVFPIEIKATPSSEVPEYLSTIQIYKPAGNVAAEVASVVDDIIPAARPVRILPAALAIGAVSGVLSGLEPLVNAGTWIFHTVKIGSVLPGWWQYVSGALQPFTHPAPLFFSLAIVAILAVWDRIAPARLALVFPITFLAWTAAYWLAFAIVAQLDQPGIMGPAAPRASECTKVAPAANEPAADNKQEDEAQPPRDQICAAIDRYRLELDPLFGRLTVLVYIFAGLAAGFVGSTLTALGLGRLSRRFRTLEAVVSIAFIGSVCGLAIALRDKEYFTLFLVWQPLVAAAIAWQLTKPEPRELA